MYKLKVSDAWYKKAAKSEEGYDISAGPEDISLFLKRRRIEREKCPKCKSYIKSASGGGVKCSKCSWWFCY